MKVINEDALWRANDYYDIEDTQLLITRGNEFVKNQKFLTSYLLLVSEETGADASEVLMNAAITWKTFVESGFDVPEISADFIRKWDEEYTAQLIQNTDKHLSLSTDENDSPLLCLLWQPLLVEYFLSFYFGERADSAALENVSVDQNAVRLNLLALLVVEMFHRIVNLESISDS